MNFDIEKWVESIRKNGEELLSFSGQITSDIISEYIEKVEAVAHRMALPRSFEKKMVHIVVESLQNLFHHSYACSENKNFKKFGAFILYIKNKNLYLTTGNYISQERMFFLKNRLEQLNILNNEEIKKIYKLILHGTGLSRKGGSGLGLIDIIKKTKHKLDFHSYDINGEVCFYELNINIGIIKQ